MGCVFCDIIARRAQAHIVYEDEATVAFMDILPVHEGHTLVVPKKHAADVFAIDPEDAAAAMRTAVKVARAVKAAFGCDGVNIFQSNGPAAGQTVFHFHIHVLPRWAGDHTIALRREYVARDGDLQQAAERIRRAIGPVS